VNVVTLTHWGLFYQKKKEKEKSNIGHKSHITRQFTDVQQLEFD
jgi:hypothetical protein